EADVEQELVWEEVPEIRRPLLTIEQRPGSWLESLLYGWQHTLVDISPFVLPLAVAAAIGMGADLQARFINDCLFAMGVATLIQTTIGNRLPIIQGPSATLTGTLAPIGAQMGAPAMWGAAFVGGLVEMVIGASRLLKFFRRFFPLTVSGVVVISIGLSLGQVAVRLSIGDGTLLNFLLAGLVIFVVIFLQIVLGRLWGGLLARGAIFFSIWLVGLGAGALLGRVNWSLLAAKPWFQLPDLFPFGSPWNGWAFSTVAVIGVLAGYLGSMIESLGDYAATCAVSGEPYRIRHMNRGIFAEGLGSALATLLGGLPCTSYTQNIGIIATTRVASRYVVQIAAVILLLYGLCPKFGALLVAIPRPVLGGVFVLVCGMIVTSGIRLLQNMKPTTTNFMVVGLTLIGATGIPVYCKYVLPGSWLQGLPGLARLLLTNTVVLAVVLAVGLNILTDVLLKPVEEGKPGRSRGPKSVNTGQPDEGD
ncbi:MAG: xanthine permease, partial [Calditrichaeota bacterium]